ncbi:hypothetical protein [Nocardioides insulae]|uniref:hypothetical protein n=1 Tax=Nocardioides insulae TaxID=394734 RepID=UPI00048C9DAC|nr:hypothetical protein [Nocardioides insulae]
MVFASDISAIKTGLAGPVVNMDEDEVDRFVAAILDLAGAVDGGSSKGETLIREIYSNQVGGSEAGTSFAFHQSLARAKTLEMVSMLADTLRQVGATTERYRDDVKVTDETAQQDLARIQKMEASLTNPDYGFDDEYPDGVPGQNPPPTDPAAPGGDGTPTGNGAPATTTDSGEETQA